ncbi:lysosome-associated membrane glycoprotein 2 isoform X1 [Brachyistius frenatus]|uniref:lysosome-associated membrane glycoprotein 2 isoform X1 n=1 Tax=Brachyistius frenatus TaxID=100188 RepID=UPI0037E7E649
MSRRAASVLFLAFGLVFQLSCGTEVKFLKEGKLCLYANLTLNFSVFYEVAENKIETAVFKLPDEVTTEGSECQATTSMLKIHFGKGHSWSVNFTASGKDYRADLVTFSYNLSDSTFFPNSVSNETASVTVKPEITNVGVDTCYSCNSKDLIQIDSVNMTLWNVLIQAFITSGSKSENVTSCAADLPTVSPTTVPTTTNTTTAAPVTNTTTAAPVTNTTTAAPVTNTTTPAPQPTPTPTPTPTLPTPTTGKYSIKPDENSTACLLVNFGLRIGFKQGEKYQEMNLESNETRVTGWCGVNSSELLLASDSMTFRFSFTSDMKKFRLHALNVTVNTSSGVAFSQVNASLALWEATVGSSYMCNKELNQTITDQLSLFTFDLQVQPFAVKKGLFSTAEECFLDSDLSFLVPIAVGVALSFLIILVLISYLIGRRKSRTGYQSV